MTKQPEALRLADVLIGSPQFTGTPIWQAADMLRAQNALIEDLQKALREVPNTQLQYADHIRRQHEAIQKLRRALDLMTAAYPTAFERGIAVKALKDTEGL